MENSKLAEVREGTRERREESFVTIRYLGGGERDGGKRAPTFDGPPTPSEWAGERGREEALSVRQGDLQKYLAQMKSQNECFL